MSYSASRVKRGMLTLFASILFVPFFEPQYFVENMPMINSLYSILRYFSMVVILGIYILQLLYKRKAPSLLISFVGIYCILLIFSTMWNGGILITSGLESLQMLSVMMLSEILLKRSVKMFVDAITPILNIIIIINFYTLLKNPTGMYETILLSSLFWSTNNNWFIGYDNVFIIYLLPALLYTIVQCYYLKRNFLSVTFLLGIAGISLYSVFSRWQAGSVVSLAFFVIVAVLILLKLDPAVFNIRNYVIGNAVLFFSIVVMRIQHLFAELIEDVLGKSLTFSGRTPIWDKSMELILKAPLVGHGVENVKTTMTHIGLNSTHNQFLWIMYRGGILQFSAFMGIVLMTMRRLYRVRSNPIARLTAAALCALFVMWQMEAITALPSMTMFAFAYYVGYVPMRTEAEQGVYGKYKKARTR